MKRHAGTLVLVLLAVALGVWLWLDRDRVTEGERKRRENSVFVAWRREELSRVSIVHEGETLVLERDLPAPGQPSHEGKEGQWRLTSPRVERADPVAVERLLSTLELATIARKVADGAATGLESPRASGAVRMGGLEIVFALGAPSPRPEGSSYLRVGGDPPIVVSKDVADALLAPFDTYRDRTVVPYLATELSRLEVTHRDGGFALERLDDHSFRIAGSSASAGVLASRAGVERLWAALAEMRAEAFPKDDDAERLTANPVATVKLVPKDAAQPAAELVIGGECPGHPEDVVVLRKAPKRVAACAPHDIIGFLSADAETLVEKHLFTLRIDEIEEVRLEHDGAKPIELARKGTGFHERAPIDGNLSEPEADAATELLTRIANSEARAVTSAAHAGGGTFAALGRVVVRSGEREQVIEVGAAAPDGHVTLRRVLDDARLDVDAAVHRRLVPRGTSLRPRTMLDREARRPVRVLLRCGVDQELVDRGEGFRLVAPAGYETDGAIVQLVDSIVKGRIDTWVSDVDDGSFGFAKDGCHVIVGFEDGNAPVTVWFGAEAEGGIYAKAEPRTGVMVAPRSLRDLAKSIYVSRGTLRVEAAKIERVKVSVGGRPVALSDPALAKDAVAGLFADKVVSLKKPEGAADLVIDVAVSEGGPPRRIACGAPAKGERLCGLDGVSATFALVEARFSPLLPRPDAGSQDAAADASSTGSGDAGRP